jgi:pilus assembly protein Flp/PilA
VEAYLCLRFEKVAMMFSSILRFIRSDDGATAVEYAVMLSLILLACFGAVILVGQATSNSYTSSAQSLANAFGGGS